MDIRTISGRKDVKEHQTIRRTKHEVILMLNNTRGGGINWIFVTEPLVSMEPMISSIKVLLQE